MTDNFQFFLDRDFEILLSTRGLMLFTGNVAITNVNPVPIHGFSLGKPPPPPPPQLWNHAGLHVVGQDCKCFVFYCS